MGIQQIVVSERSDPLDIRKWLALETDREKRMLVMGDPGDRNIRHCTSMAVARGIPIEVQESQVQIRRQPTRARRTRSRARPNGDGVASASVHAH